MPQPDPEQTSDDLIDRLNAAWRPVLEEQLGSSPTRSVPELLRELETRSFASALPLPSTNMVVLSSSSATGKTHLGQILRLRGWHPIARYKDRPARVDEVDGVDGHYVDHATFDALLAENQLVGVTGSYGDRRGYRLDEIVQKVWQHGRCVSSDGYSLVKLALQAPLLRPLKIASIYLLPPDLPTLVQRMISRAFLRFDACGGITPSEHLRQQKVAERLSEAPRYLREAFEILPNGAPLVDRFVVYDDPERVMQLLGIPL